MNRTEQKERLREIISYVEQAKKETEKSKVDLVVVYKKMDDLISVLGRVGIDSTNVIQEEDMKSKILSEYLCETIDFEFISDTISDFSNDIEYYKDEVSESRAEVLEERYANLSEVIDFLDINVENDGLTADDVLDRLDQALDMLKEMLR